MILFFSMPYYDLSNLLFIGTHKINKHLQLLTVLQWISLYLSTCALTDDFFRYIVRNVIGVLKGIHIKIACLFRVILKDLPLYNILPLTFYIGIFNIAYYMYVLNEAKYLYNIFSKWIFALNMGPDVQTTYKFSWWSLALDHSLWS